MKRLLIDAIFIFILVSLGSSMQKDSPAEIKENLDSQLQSFEEDIAMHREIKEVKDPVKLNNITENKASSFAKETSDIVVEILDSSLSVVSEVFRGILD